MEIVSYGAGGGAGAAWGALKYHRLASGFTYSYTEQKQQEDHDRIAPLTAHLAAASMQQKQ